MTHLDEKALEAAKNAFALEGGHDATRWLEAAIRAYLSALPSSPVSDLVERETHLRSRFNNAVAAWPDIAARVADGQQFNEWEYASNGDDDDPDDLEYFIGIGPVGNLFSFQSVEGQRKADLIASALKLAAFVTSNPLTTRNAELERGIDRLAAYIMENVPGEPSENQGAVDTAIRLLGKNAELEREVKRLREALGQIEDHTEIDDNLEIVLSDPALIAREALSTSPQGGEHE